MTLGLIATVAAEAGISADSARRIAQSAAHRYKVFTIPKRRGGVRLVAQPAREVKALQRALVEFLEPLLPLHPAAMGYRKGVSILDNAERHVAAKYLLKLDFSGFFPSIGADAVRAHLVSKCPERFSRAELDFIAGLVLWLNKATGQRGLCIGAPSSPILSNSVMFDFDSAVEMECDALEVVYTRYSDDLSLSAKVPGVLEEAERRVRKVCSELAYPRLAFNESKRVSVGRGSAFHVTGLTLANQGHVTVGRDRKRGVRAGVKKYISGALEDEAIERLRGEIAFVLSIEPKFREVLLRTYEERCLALLPRSELDQEYG